MPLVKSITAKRINVLGVFRLAFIVLFLALSVPVLAQDNSPYSRYGLGDIVPSTNIIGRGMGGISAAYNDFLSINYSNPASYGSFQTVKEATSKKILYGRAMLDVGMNFESRTLREPNNINKFTASNALFSHVQVAVPLKPNWGLSFGLRPVTRISYKIDSHERLVDPNTGQSIDTAVTSYQGDGGLYLASIGTGFKFNTGKYSSIAFGINGGYMFGKKDISTRRSIFNDSIIYNSGNFQTSTSYGNLYATVGVQLQTRLKENLYLSLGAFGNMKQNLNASQDIKRETYYFDESLGNVRLDSVSDQKNIKGKVVYPSSFTVGFVLEKTVTLQKAGWLVGVDFTQTNWDDYRFYGQPDATVQSNWQVKFGAQLRPVPKNNYFSNAAYRFGFFTGNDYIKVGNKLPLLGATLGMGLPLKNWNRLSPGEAKVINLALEYIKRGNNDNLLKENLFRVSVSFALSDFWFAKKKYE
jgi:hypothetical protein